MAGKFIGDKQHAKTDKQPKPRERQPLRPSLRLGMK
jgi:hypothetical protein